MKQKDLALIIMVAGVAGIASLFISKAIFTGHGNREQKVEIVDKVTTDFTQPSQRYFNPSSIDPTQLIQIGNASNSNPFGAGNGAQ